MRVVREPETEKHERSTAETESVVKRLVPGKKIVPNCLLYVVPSNA